MKYQYCWCFKTSPHKIHRWEVVEHLPELEEQLVEQRNHPDCHIWWIPIEEDELPEIKLEIPND